MPGEKLLRVSRGNSGTEELPWAPKVGDANASQTKGVTQSLGSKSNARKVSPVRKRWEEFTNRFLARLMSVFGDLKSLGVLNASPAKRARERERSQCSALPTSRSCASEGRRPGKCT